MTPLGYPIVIQARMSSQRCPAKMLRDLAGCTVLERVVARTGGSRLAGGVRVATSRESSDDPIAAWCMVRGVPCERGPLDDVARRMLDATADAEAFVRICGDSPFIDPELIDRMIEAFDATPCDLATNVLERTFPAGQSVEVVRRSALAAVADQLTADEREHVTRHFYLHPADWRISSVTADEPHSDERMVVDTPDDLERWTQVMGRLEQTAPDAARLRWPALLSAAHALVSS